MTILTSLLLLVAYALAPVGILMGFRALLRRAATPSRSELE